MEKHSQSQTTAPNEWERIRLAFIDAYEAGHHPTLDAFVALYPQYADELTDFILDYLQVENALARREAQEASQGNIQDTPAPYAIEVWKKTLASLGISTEGILDQTPEVTLVSATATLNEIRKSRNWSPRHLAQQLQIPLGVVVKLQSGLIRSWPQLLSELLADTLRIAVTEADAILTQTRNANRSIAAAFSAQGQPETETIVQKQGEVMTFEEAMAEEVLTDAQKRVWQMK
jgi:hypothetical protein